MARNSGVVKAMHKIQGVIYYLKKKAYAQLLSFLITARLFGG